MATIPEELTPTGKGETLPAKAPTGLERRTGRAVGPVFGRSEPMGGRSPLPGAAILTGQEEVSTLLRKFNIDSRFTAAYQQYHTDMFSLQEDPLAQFELRNSAVTTIRQYLSHQTSVADALIQALPVGAHRVPFGKVALFFNDRTSRVLGTPQGLSPKAVVQQVLSKGLVHGPQMQILQNQLAVPGTPAIQAMTLQQSQASQKKAQAAANAFGVQLRMAIIDLHLEEPQEVEQPKAEPEEVMVAEGHHLNPRAKEQQVQKREGADQQHIEGPDPHKRTEKEAAQKRREKDVAEEEFASRTQEQRKKKQEIAQGERQAGEKRKEQMKHL